jgi:hypothetical protein
MNHRARRIAAGILFLAVVLAFAPIVSGVSSPARSPYLSALSDLAAPAALADPGCNNKACQKDPRKGPNCFQATGANCINTGGTCSATTCV